MAGHSASPSAEFHHLQVGDLGGKTRDRVLGTAPPQGLADRRRTQR